ncbi:histidine phosphatase superfamily [Hyaloraphidium curvatum]|nr:histidine phosphatase superfamily [Hyaloraphidium curvatum]
MSIFRSIGVLLLSFALLFLAPMPPSASLSSASPPRLPALPPFPPADDPRTLSHVPLPHVEWNDSDVSKLGVSPGHSWTELLAAARDAGAKVVLLVRHGEGIHNAAERELGKERWREEATDPKYFDPPLNDAGLEQAANLGAAVSGAAEGGLELDALVVSPLTRALETGAIGFKDFWERVPVVAAEMVRERHGRNICDMRRARGELRGAYPEVDFGLLEGDEDPWHDPVAREDPSEVRLRALRTLKWILDGPWARVAIIGHSDWISHAVEAAGYPSHWPSNTEMVPLVIRWG